jgi:hypothetical protein
MRQLALAVVVVAVVARGASADAPQPVTLRALFPKEAEVTIEKPGVSRLPLPPEVIGACRPDLSDLRLLDSSGNEMAFFLDSGVDPKAKVEVIESAEATVVDVDREEIRREDGPTIYREAYQLTVPGAAPGGGQWEIVVKTASPRSSSSPKERGKARPPLYWYSAGAAPDGPVTICPALFQAPESACAAAMQRWPLISTIRRASASRISVTCGRT